MNYFYDTEFIEDGEMIELLSIGIVAEDGREYYAVNRRARIYRASPWVRDNVIPHLPTLSYCDEPACREHLELNTHQLQVKSTPQIASDVYNFLISSDDAERPKLWADFAAYDHVALCQLWGPMVDLPKPLPYFTHELEQLWEQVQERRAKLGLRPSKKPVQTDSEHHALHDARYDRDLWFFCCSQLERV